MSDTFLHTYLAALLGPEPDGDLLEIRYRRPGAGMAQCFHSATDLDTAARVIHGLGARTDVYVGAAPRAQHCGCRQAVRHSWALWADCDDATASRRLDAVPSPPPSIVVRSGSPGARHAYWLLDTPLPPDAVEVANRRLAVALGADLRSTDAGADPAPARARSNFKHEPPAPVVARAHGRSRGCAPTTSSRTRRGSPAPPRRARRRRSRQRRPAAPDRARRVRPRPARRRRPAQPQDPLPVPRRPHPEPARLRDARGRLVLLRLRRGTSIYDMAAERLRPRHPRARLRRAAPPADGIDVAAQTRFPFVR